MSLNYEMARYTELTGQDGTKVPISRLGGYLDGYEKGREDEREKVIDEVEKILNGICYDTKNPETRRIEHRIRAELLEEILQLKKQKI